MFGNVVRKKNLRANSLVYETRILGCRYTITCRTRGDTASGRKGLLKWASKSLRGDDLRNYDEMPVRDLVWRNTASLI